LGFVLKINNFEASPIVLGMILGPIAEQGLNQSMVLARGGSLIGYFAGRPIVIVLFIFIIISLFAPLLRDTKFVKRVFSRKQNSNNTN
jgi:putative tricarboxylic transport membrane protein